MKAVNFLPDGYKEICSIDLQKNKKLAFLINFFAAIIGVVLIIPMHFLVPITSLLDMSGGLSRYFIRLFSLLILMIVYIILHELVHGIAMKLCGTKKVKYGYTGLYAFAGSDDYYDKKSYIFIALSPIVFWGIVLAVVNFIVPTEWFWVIYFIQIINLSGAAGDIYVTAKFSKLPKDILVNDVGVGMTVYSSSNTL